MPESARFSVTFARNVILYVGARGVEAGELCRQAGFPRELLETPDELIAGDAVDRVWRAAVELVGDEHLGLHLGESVQPVSLGLLGFAMLSCERVGDALEKMVRYWNLLTDATKLRVTRAGGRARVEMELVDLPGNFLLRNHQPVESSLSAAVSLVGGLSGRRARVLEATFTHAAPAGGVREHERVFGRRPEFEAESNGVVFEAEVLEWSVAHANRSLGAALEEQIQRTLAREEESVRGRVRREVARRLRGETPELEAVAKALALSERGLQRELQAEGTTFREVVDDLRKDLAAEYLRDPRHSLLDVSFLLGLSEPSVLHRFVRRWFGCTPAEYRKAQQLPAQQRAPH
ncbi:MAG: AraC family transcriptional regulator [Bryobacteraceae bacterium]|nr:AraC family transcriptional regulator [Bryobacteraceae bacterium]